jgi:PDZ domain-containing protein
VSLFPDGDELARREADGTGEHGSRSTSIGWVLIASAIAGTVVLGLLPAPYVIERPGPVYDTLGDVQIEGETLPVIEISGAETFPTDGRLDLLTVSIEGSRESPPSWIEVAAAWFQRERAVVPVDSVYPEGQTQEEADQESAADMVNSQEEAIAAAFEELDIGYRVAVAAVIPGTPAEGVLEPADVVVEANGTEIDSITQLRESIGENGIERAMTLVIERDGDELVVDITPVAASPTDPTPVIGVQSDYIFPFDVTIQLDNVGGPSAGTMFALGTYDKLTEGPLTGGVHVAGTGTITAAGAVGPIGGIRQKLYGARDAGATTFLAPAANCDEVVGHIPAGLDVYSIATLDDAIAVVEAVGDQRSTSNLARCAA